ncbi:MAG: hypothetical protein ACEPO8_09610 [Rhodothermaceae bacterium]
MKQLTILLVILVNFVFAQEIGEIFDNKDVPGIFGKKISEVKIEADVIRKAILETGEHILFKITEDNVVICNSSLKILYSKKKIECLDPEWIYKLFSTSVIERLLDSQRITPDKFVYFEIREKDSVVRYEEQSADKTIFCPPMCPNEINDVANNYLHINNFMVVTTN